MASAMLNHKKARVHVIWSSLHEAKRMQVQAHAQGHCHVAFVLAKNTHKTIIWANEWWQGTFVFKLKHKNLKALAEGRLHTRHSLCAPRAFTLTRLTITLRIKLRAPQGKDRS